ncbi:MAG: hypothetical protein IK100_10135 [Muribaculaceae bacterium]|nr:hypothetical protein [Muribaculaceae bacterium]
MKKSKAIILAVATLLMLGATNTACKQQTAKNQDSEPQQSSKVEDETVDKANFQATCAGDIDHNTWKPNATTSVEFNAFPTNIAEWKHMQELLGDEPQGAAALQVMAFELYRNNRTDGEEALRLNNTSTNFNSTIARLHEMMGSDKNYARPYIAMAMLNGATPENGYTVEPPYSIKIKVDPNKKYQESQMLHGTVIYLLIYSKGWDTNWRGVEVVRPEGSNYFVVANCPAMYTQCKEAKTSK